MEEYQYLKAKMQAVLSSGEPQTISEEINSVQFSLSVVSNSLRPHGLQHARLPCPSPIPEACSNSCPLSWWCHPTTSSSVVPFSSLLHSFPASGSFPMNQFFISGGQSIGISASASVPPVNIQDWFPLELTGLALLSLEKKNVVLNWSKLYIWYWVYPSTLVRV